ncbi:MAG: 4-Hydroxy-2-oxoglutarate aldolase [Bacteroidota bacterium]|jgi:2-dehydro-3-deoxyphosphogluconate aldolase/(4S)-4-hydroxy-2-oxoglutarate aldolase
MKQNNIRGVLEKHPIIPVVTINNESEIDGIIKKLQENGISCIEITLRTDYALTAIKLIKSNYGDKISVGVGTVVAKDQIDAIKALKVDFIVSPGINETLGEHLMNSGIPFIPGVATPSDIILGIQMGWDTFKFFPANLFGGIEALKTYGQVFPSVKFCPTGGINSDSHNSFLELTNVISIGGSWMMK